MNFIHLEEDRDDKLVWTKNLVNGDFMAKLGYKTWVGENFQGEMEEWWKQLWKVEVPLKAKVTLWLTLNNKILTWDNLQKRGWNGPNWCALCNSNEENVSHLFNFCSYADTVWKETCRELKFQGAPGTTLEYKSKSWWTEKSVCLHSAFPSLFTYGI